MPIEDAVARDLPGVIAITMGCLIGIIIPTTYIVMTNWRKVRQHEQNAVLKKAMLDRGMSADDIAAVIQSGTGHEVWENEHAVATMQKMIKNGYAAEDIAKLMRQGPNGSANIKA